MSKPNIPNVLAQRYATPQMCEIWSETGKILLERKFWLTIMRGQAALGINIPEEAIDDYERVMDHVDLASIEERERKTRHDVKARIEEFNALAGHEYAHLGMTSRDLTENVEQMQILQSLQLIRVRVGAALVRLRALALEHEDVVMAGRSHNVAAQPTTMGKRFAMCSQELLLHWDQLENLIQTYPLRGLKGPMGTTQDQIDLLGNAALVDQLETIVLEYCGFKTTLDAVGQIYPRSLDHTVISVLFGISAAPSSFATTVRLMAGQELATEGFKKGQVGSSAMPHKMNARTSERINGFNAILAGYQMMTAGLAGKQWNEGDVSCSVVRRVALPDAFFALDGQLESFLTVLDEMGVYRAVIQRELERYLPFLTTTAVLVACVRKGMGREAVHAVIKEHALTVVKDMRESDQVVANDLFARLEADPRIPLDRAELGAILANPLDHTGDARQQIRDIDFKIDEICRVCPEVVSYRPGDIL